MFLTSVQKSEEKENEMWRTVTQLDELLLLWPRTENDIV
jgi:hypothetical protein